MIKIAQVATIAVIALALTGCSAAVTDAPNVSSAKVAPIETSTPAESGEPVAAPIDIAPTAVSTEFNGFASQDDWYLRSLAGALSGAPADDALIGAGKLACEQIKAGTARESVRVVSGTDALADQDNRNIVGAAVEVYCPELA